MQARSKTAKAAKKKLTCAEREAILAMPGLIAAWGIKRVDSEKLDLARIRELMLGEPTPAIADEPDEPAGGTKHGRCCSVRWFLDFWHAAVQYPPGGERRTGMRQCRGCRAIVPGIYLGSSGHCLDCRLEGLRPGEAARLPSSASVIDYRGLKNDRARSDGHN